MTVTEFLTEFKPNITNKEITLLNEYIASRTKEAEIEEFKAKIKDCKPIICTLKSEDELTQIGAEWHSPPDSWSAEHLTGSLRPEFYYTNIGKELTVYEIEEGAFVIDKDNPTLRSWMINISD